MGIADFSKLLQNQVYKEWVKKLDSIATKTATQLRSKELTATKTRFYLMESQLREIITTIAGKELKIDNSDVQLLLASIAGGGLTQQEAELEKIPFGITTNINGENAIKFDNISYNLISDRLKDVLDTIPEVAEGYKKAEDEFRKEQLKELKSNPKYISANTKTRRNMENDIEKAAKERAEIGFYFNKGHVISVATNLARQFQQKVVATDKLAEKQKEALKKLLDLYIEKLTAEDLATANLPPAVYQEMWADYEKDPEKYIVEIQLRSKNLSSGSLSRTQFDELRSILDPKVTQLDLEKIVSNSTFIKNLANSYGSKKFTELIAVPIVDALTKTKTQVAKAKIPKVKIGEKKTNIVKPSSNKPKIAQIKKLRSKIASATKKPNLIVNTEPSYVESNLVGLQNLLNAKLVQTIKENMGLGNRRDILNLRSGRFAESVQVKKLSESRQGMITAFYTYMRNPYATFSEGGRQQNPRSRDPKLLISKSIRQLAQQITQQRLRAVLV